ncbi:MAG: hypothetical protein ACR2N0_04200, partial [Rubrobacteraceae bacterium]
GQGAPKKRQKKPFSGFRAKKGGAKNTPPPRFCMAASRFCWFVVFANNQQPITNNQKEYP